MSLRFISSAGIPLSVRAAADDFGFVAGGPVFIGTSDAVNLYPFGTTLAPNAGGDIVTLVAASDPAGPKEFLGISDDQSNTAAANSTVISGAFGGVRATESVLGASNVILPGIPTHEASGMISVYTSGIYATSAFELRATGAAGAVVPMFNTTDLTTYVPGAFVSAYQGTFVIQPSERTYTGNNAIAVTNATFLGFRLLEPSDVRLEGLGDAGSYESKNPRIYALIKIS